MPDAPTPRRVALDVLSRREHSPTELRRKLQARGFEAEAIDATLAALTREGLLSEERFVALFIGSQARRGRGPVWIRAELERRGVPGPVIGAALAGADEDWAARAWAARVKRFGSAAPADLKARARQARFLRSRGYTPDQIRAASAPGTGADLAGEDGFPDDGD